MNEDNVNKLKRTLFAINRINSQYYVKITMKLLTVTRLFLLLAVRYKRCIKAQRHFLKQGRSYHLTPLKYQQKFHFNDNLSALSH